MKLRFALVLGLAVLACPVRAADPAPPSPAAPATPAVENSVVKIFSTIRYPALFKPWTKEEPHNVRASGIVIEGKRILTNAHVVMYATQIQIQANQAGDKLPATVESVAPGIDLAVLKLDDESFFDTHPPLARTGVLPAVKDSVLAYGFPTGGDSLSITKGIVSRIEFVPYNFPVAGLRIQIDAAINPGNSGGPAMVGDRMIGLAFSHLNTAENIGYIIPCEEIEYFLKQVAGGKPYQKPMFPDEIQTLENPALRASLKLPKGAKGMVVARPEHDDAGYPLKKWDVITKIGPVPIDDEGMVRIGENLRLRFVYLVQKQAVGEHVPLTIIRGGKQLEISMPVPATRPMLLRLLNGAYPNYFIFGPMVFSTATADAANGLGRVKNGFLINLLSAIESPLITRRANPPAFPGEELVIIAAPFFPHILAKGYDSPQMHVVKSVNDIPIKNLAHLVEVLRDAQGEFIKFEFQGRGVENLIFPRQATLTATEDILADNGVRAQGSPELLKIWNAKKSAP